MTNVLLGKTLSELQEVALAVGLQKFAGKQLAEWLYVRRVTSFDQMTNISLKGREALKANYTIGRHAPVREAVSVDGTRKYLFEVGEQFVESVYIPEEDRATLCVSTQAGCKMGCRFCMTGTLGFHGHLSAADILNQIFFGMSVSPKDGLSVKRSVSESGLSGEAGLTNIVFMGEGEPMDNLDNVLRALEIMTAPYACAWSPKRITVSTVGIPAMKRFLDESECHLAVSMHNPFPAERAEIMPAEKLMSITDVVALLKQYDWSHQRRVSFEYICWAGQNDTPRHAKELLRLLKGLNCRINLIRFHEGVEDVKRPTSNDLKQPQTTSNLFKPSNEQSMLWLRDYLTANGLTTTIRRSRGEDILAACGMLVNALQQPA
ncbi:MAG: 23S rRNA (adenine(2503)-C(2))-methyltransferase RlmN [Paludibacteraceae bacterium]|nr:23S rRNA (adenine(2503)-C(2))-methyltransferase RlmN [Paludibacteraceae bacterium]